MTGKVSEYSGHQNGLFRKMVRIIRTKFIKYFANIPLVFTCAATLNPCLNVSGVELLIRSILENLEISDGIDNVEFLEQQIFRFNDNFQKLFGIYATTTINTR